MQQQPHQPQAALPGGGSAVQAPAAAMPVAAGVSAPVSDAAAMERMREYMYALWQRQMQQAAAAQQQQPQQQMQQQAQQRQMQAHPQMQMQQVHPQQQPQQMAAAPGAAVALTPEQLQYYQQHQAYMQHYQQVMAQRQQQEQQMMAARQQQMYAQAAPAAAPAVAAPAAATAAARPAEMPPPPTAPKKQRKRAEDGTGGVPKKAKQAARPQQQPQGVPAAAAAVPGSGLPNGTNAAAYAGYAAAPAAFTAPSFAAPTPVPAGMASVAAPAAPAPKQSKAALHAAHEAELLARLKARDAEDEQNLFPRAILKRIIKNGLPAQQQIEKSATRAINLSAVDFCHLITSEAHHIRMQEKQLRSQISIQDTLRCVKEAEAADGGGVPAEEEKASPAWTALVKRHWEENLSEPLLPERGTADEVPPPSYGDGRVLSGHHILAALHRLGFSQIARVVGSFFLNQVLLPNEEANDAARQARRATHMSLLKVQPQHGQPQEEKDMHIPTDPAAADTCCTEPDPEHAGQLRARPSSVADVSDTWRHIAEGDADRQRQQQLEERRRGLQQWLDGPFTPLYPSHPLTQPNYQPEPCKLGDKCITELERSMHANAAARAAYSPQKPAKPAAHASAAAAAQPPRPRKAAVKKEIKERQVYAAGELGPPKKARAARPVGDAASSAAAAATASTPATPASLAPAQASSADADMVLLDLVGTDAVAGADDEDTGIRQENDDDDPVPAQAAPAPVPAPTAAAAVAAGPTPDAAPASDPALVVPAC